MKKLAIFIFFIFCAISSFAQTAVKPMTFYANPSALDSIAYTYPGKTSLDWLYRARYIRQILGVTTQKDTLSIKDFIGIGTGADPFRLTTDTTRIGNFIVRYSNGFLGKDTNKYLPLYLNSNPTVRFKNHYLSFGDTTISSIHINPLRIYPDGQLTINGDPSSITGGSASLYIANQFGNNAYFTAGGLSVNKDGVPNVNGLITAYNLSTGNYFPGVSDVSVDEDATSANKTITLPDVSTYIGQVFIFKKADASAHTVTITPAGGQTIDGQSSIVLTNQYDWVAIQGGGNTLIQKWNIIGQSIGGGYLPKSLFGNITVTGGAYGLTFTNNSGTTSTLTVSNTNSSNAPALTVNGQTQVNGQLVVSQSFYSPTLIIPVSPDPQPNIYLSHVDTLFSITRPGRPSILMRDSSIFTGNAVGTIVSRFLTTADLPSGGAGTTTNPITFNNSGSGASSGTTFNGSAARTISYNTIGAQPQLNGTGFVKATGTTISYDNSTYLTGNQTITLSGDISGSGATAITGTLATVNSSPGSYGDASHSLSATVNGKGLITSLSTNSIQIAESQVTNLTSDLAAKLTSSNFVASEIPSGSINSSNTSYTLANTPVSGTVKIYRNGLRQIVGTDYTISGTSITYLYAPTSGDTLLADYQK